MDDNTIENVIEEYGDMLYRLALFYVRTSADAEDVVHDVLLAYLQKDGQKNRAWLVKVTVHKCLNLLRARRREAPFEEEEHASSPLGGELYEALGGLSPRDRQAVWMFYFGGYTTREIAKATHTGEAAVRKRLERARKRLKKFLEEV